MGHEARAEMIAVRRMAALPALCAVLLLATGCSMTDAGGRSTSAVSLTGAQATTSEASAGGASTSGGSTTSSTGASTRTGRRIEQPSAPSTTGPKVSASGTSSPASRVAGPDARLPAVPPGPAEPPTRLPDNPPAIGSGANALVQPVPDPVWAAMVGYSWTPGCPVGRAGLRYVGVNFWGWDGLRSRGHLVVARSIAAPTAAAFTRLYALHLRIRQMRVMDRSWGHEPVGPGADDYVSMNADNTSAFNCRYVGGVEARHQWSNHAYGLAIDVDDFENPYVDPDGVVFPDTYFRSRRQPYPGVFTGSADPAVRVFTALGFRWGGLWRLPDFQHFEIPRRATRLVAH